MTGTLQAAVVVALLAVGGFFMTVGTVGIIRLPDAYNRLHANSKATTFGAASFFLAGFAYYGPTGAGMTSLVGIGFVFLTAPTGAHMIARAAKRLGVEFYGEAEWPVPDPEEEPHE
ncbi:MAG: monovalent cation/H(+) antiporter subunit G [Halobacteriales archaeon]|nr:monovalent cation/H(+) antiporter subunit G [Halobacteriales archaeon]